MRIKEDDREDEELVDKKKKKRECRQVGGGGGGGGEVWRKGNEQKSECLCLSLAKSRRRTASSGSDPGSMGAL